MYYPFLTLPIFIFSLLFFFNDTATTEIYTLSLHDALPICPYDFTYLEILKAIEEIPDWELSNTEKSAGIIVLNNHEYWDAFDADKRQAVLEIKSVDKDRKSTRLNSSHGKLTRMPSSA